MAWRRRYRETIESRYLPVMVDTHDGSSPVPLQMVRRTKAGCRTGGGVVGIFTQLRDSLEAARLLHMYLAIAYNGQAACAFGILGLKVALPRQLDAV